MQNGLIELIYWIVLGPWVEGRKAPRRSVVVGSIQWSGLLIRVALQRRQRQTQACEAEIR